MISLVEYASSDSGGDSDPEITEAVMESRLSPDGPRLGCVSRKVETSKPAIITVPSLSEFDDIDDEPSLKRCKVSTGTGLFSVLPPPKNTMTSKVMNRSLVPHSVAKHQSMAAASNPSPSVPVNVNALSSSDEMSKEADDGVCGDFFSLDNVTNDTRPTSYSGVADSSQDPELPIAAEAVSTTTDSPERDAPEDAPLQFDAGWVSSSNVGIEHASSSSDRLAYDAQAYNKADVSEGGGSSSVSSFLDQASMFNDEGFLRMVGKSRHKREDIQIVDVAQDDQLPKYEEWLTKALTEDVANRPSRKKGFMPTSQQRRKHQITYLAFQAREREVELKNQWAENRLSRRQTQSKYGF